VILILYVGDILFIRDNLEKIIELEIKLEKYFEMSKSRLAHFYIGVGFVYV
jgi:hypothetical protein